MFNRETRHPVPAAQTGRAGVAGRPLGRPRCWPRPARRFLVWSGVIHLQLWSDGYKDISVIGPLFLVQGIASIVARPGPRRLPPAGAAGRGRGDRPSPPPSGCCSASSIGLFGYTESLAVPYAELSLVVEFTAAAVLAGRRGHPRLAAPPRRRRS